MFVTEPFNPSIDKLSDYGSMLKVGIDKELQTLLCANPDLVVDVGETREMKWAGSVASSCEQMGGKRLVILVNRIIRSYPRGIFFFEQS